MQKNSKLALFTIAALVLAVAFTAPVLAGEKHQKAEKGDSTTVIPVSGMTCGGCASAIKTAVKKMDGVTSVEVDHEGGKTSVTFNKEMVTVAEIVKTINKTGFKATAPTDS
jgi:copper chaperone CopZ